MNDAALGTPSAPVVDGVLFDLDDTLLDLRTAQLAAFAGTVRRHWPDAPAEDTEAFAAAAHHFAADLGGHYSRYMAGELDFLGQRTARARDALVLLGAAEVEPHREAWERGYEELVRSHWALFDDVLPAVAAFRAAGVGVGIITNNVEAYQRAKADALGLQEITVLVGSDTAGAPKPDPAPFLEGCRRLGTEPTRTVCVGDSLSHDVRGAARAGLVPVWLRRDAEDPAASPTWDAEAGAWCVADLSALEAWLARR